MANWEDAAREDRIVRRIREALKEQVEMGNLECESDTDYPAVKGRLNLRQMAREMTKRD